MKEEKEKQLQKELEKENKTINDEPLIENMNRVQEDVVTGSGIDAALAAMRLVSYNTIQKLPMLLFYDIK